MPLPSNLVDLASAGYRHAGSSKCKFCGATIEWFYTKKNRKMPFSLKVDLVVGEESIYLKPSVTVYEPHFGSCSRRQQ